MLRITSGMLSCLGTAVGIAACASNGTADPPLSEANQTALEALGIAEAVRHDGGFTLLDSTGAELGTVWFERGGVVGASVRGHVARTEITPQGTIVTCDGRSIFLAGSTGSLEARSSELLLPCEEARRVASLLVHPASATETSSVNALVGCHQEFIDGCVNWNAEQGCTEALICNVRWCDNGWSSYECLSYDPRQF
jgi:hypothetical protein